MKSKPNGNHTHYCFAVQNRVTFNSRLPLRFTHTQMEHFLRTRLPACGRNNFLSVRVCVKVSDKRGVCVHMHAQLFSLARQLAEIDGEKCPIKRKPM